MKSRKFSKPEQDFIAIQIHNLLKEDKIEESFSPWRAQVIVTSEGRHKRRMVVDYSRTINKYTFVDAYPLPKLDEVAKRIAKFKVYSAFDLSNAYHQIPIVESDREMTAFEANGRLYQWKCIPFGVGNGNSAFQRTMDYIIKKHNLKGTEAYIDNVTVCGDTQEQHDENVTRWLEIVDLYGLGLNHDKTISSVEVLDTLGYQISFGNIRPDPQRMVPLLNLPVPTGTAALKRSLGLFSYYSQWVDKFSDKIQPLVTSSSFPLTVEAVQSFNQLKRDIAQASVACPNDHDLLILESDASDVALSACLNQNGKPVSFFSRTLQTHERHYAPVEKEACAVVEACRKFRHYLVGKKFLLVTDQEAVSFMFNSSGHGKIKNDKICRWRIELSTLDFDIKYRPGVLNVTADCLTRASMSCSLSSAKPSLQDIHESLCHPGATRLCHYVSSKNLPFSASEVREVTSKCRICAELKPAFYKPHNPPLIKSTTPMERLSIDFKGPLPESEQGNSYLLTVIDEYSRFPFAAPCRDIESKTVKQILTNIFTTFGLAGYIHSDRGPSLISQELRNYLLSLGIGASNTTSYNPRGNGQCEKYNGVIWKGIQLALKTKGLDNSKWESVLPDVLHSQRSLLCTATNCTPHDRMFSFLRRSVTGVTLPAWLCEKGPVLLRRNVRRSKYEPYADEVELLHSGPTYACVKLQNGTMKNVSLRHLAPLPPSSNTDNNTNISEPVIVHHDSVPIQQSNGCEDVSSLPSNQPGNTLTSEPSELHASPKPDLVGNMPLRRSSREKRTPDFYQAGVD